MNTQNAPQTNGTVVEINAHGVEVGNAFRQYIEDKISSLEEVWPRIDDAHINLACERGVCSSEITLVSAGLVTRGEMRADDPRVAFDNAVEKIEKQLRRYKKKAISRERRHDNRNGLEIEHTLVAAMNGVPHAEREEEHYDTRVRTKQFVVKPMSADEAALQMDLLGHNFYVFRDADSNDVSVVYKRHSGGYGLLEPVLG